jgi:hypothetical protein
MKRLIILYLSEYYPPYTKNGVEINTSLMVKYVTKFHLFFLLLIFLSRTMISRYQVRNIIVQLSKYSQLE